MTALAGRVAVVTGASRGIGRAVALQLADAGADVAIAGREAHTLDEVALEIEARGRRALPVVTDVRDEGQVERLFDAVVHELGVPYAVVNNSGVVNVAPLLDTTLEAWTDVISTNLTGTFLSTRAAGRHLVGAGRGTVVNIASNLGLIGRANFAAYCASKAAIISFTRAVALEWAPSGVQVNAVAPGLVATEMNAEARSDAELSARILARIPLRRMATPDEVAAVVVSVVSPTSSFMVGETIVLDGGESIR